MHVQMMSLPCVAHPRNPKGQESQGPLEHPSHLSFTGNGVSGNCIPDHLSGRFVQVKCVRIPAGEARSHLHALNSGE